MFDPNCCVFQLVIYCCAHPGERLLIRKGPCSGPSACNASPINTQPSTIRSHCAECKVRLFFKELLVGALEFSQQEFESMERRARCVRMIKCAKCGAQVDTDHTHVHLCPDLRCSKCDKSFASGTRLKDHVCSAESEAWAIGCEPGEGALIVHKRPPVLAQGRSRNGSVISVLRAPQTMFSLRNLSHLSLRHTLIPSSSPRPSASSSPA